MVPVSPKPGTPSDADLSGFPGAGAARRMFEASRTPTAVADADDGTVLAVNPAWRALLGEQDPGPGSLRLDDLLVPDAGASLGGGLLAAAASGPIEAPLFGASGRIAWCVVSVDPLPAEAGGRSLMLVQAEDVTDRRRADDRRRLAETRFRTLAGHIPAIVCVHPLDPDQPAIYISPRIEQIVGYRPDELPRRRSFLRDLLHPDDVDAVLAADEESDRMLEPVSLRYRVRHRDGRWVWLHELSEIVRDRDGTPRYWQGLLLDVTAEMEAEAALAESEARFRALVQHAKDITVIVDRDGVIAWVSPAVTRLLGHAPEEIVGTSSEGYSHPDDREREEELDRMVLSAPGAVGSAEYRLRHRDGSWRWVEIVAANHLDDPAVQGVVYAIREITARKRAEQELAAALEAQRMAVDRLEEMARQRAEFVAVLAHDLRTPLTAVQGYADLLAAEDLGDPELAGFATVISESAQRMNRMVTALLDVETLEGRLGAPDLRPARIDEVVAAAVSALQGAWPDRGIAVVADGALPPVTMDRDQVTQAVTNLVGNALNYSADDAPVTVRITSADGAVEIAVEDGGFGIAPEQLETVFDKYARIRSRDTDGIAGSGLGLPIVRAIARAHGGEAWAESAPGVGSTFRLRLPVAGPPGS